MSHKAVCEPVAWPCPLLARKPFTLRGFKEWPGRFIIFQRSFASRIARLRPEWWGWHWCWSLSRISWKLLRLTLSLISRQRLNNWSLPWHFFLRCRSKGIRLLCPSIEIMKYLISDNSNEFVSLCLFVWLHYLDFNAIKIINLIKYYF